MKWYYWAIFLATIVDIILYSIFPIFNRVEPTVGGLPFFYTYQIIMLAVTTVIYLIVALFVKG